MRMQSGIVDQYIYFVAVDATDMVTRETGLSAFTVYRSRNGGAATAYTTPTITEVDSTNMPGVYKFLLDEDMTIDAGDDSQEMCFHITCSGMAPVTRTIELYRPIVTAGGTLTVTSGRANADVTHIATAAVSTSTAQLGVNVVNFGGSAGTFASGRPEVNTTHAAGTAWGSGAITAAAFAADAITAAKVAADVGTEIGTAVWATAARTLTANTNLNDLSAAGVRAAVGLASANLDTQLTAIDDFLDTEIAAIKAKTDNLPTDPADESLIIAATDAIAALIGTPAGVSLSADVAAVKSDTAAILTDTGTTLDGNITAIKAKTDSLTFTVANQVDANIKSVAGTTVTGVGSEADPWGP